MDRTMLGNRDSLGEHLQPRGERFAALLHCDASMGSWNNGQTGGCCVTGRATIGSGRDESCHHHTVGPDIQSDAGGMHDRQCPGGEENAQFGRSASEEGHAEHAERVRREVDLR